MGSCSSYRSMRPCLCCPGSSCGRAKGNIYDNIPFQQTDRIRSGSIHHRFPIFFRHEKSPPPRFRTAPLPGGRKKQSAPCPGSYGQSSPTVSLHPPGTDRIQVSLKVGTARKEPRKPYSKRSPPPSVTYTDTAQTNHLSHPL